MAMLNSFELFGLEPKFAIDEAARNGSNLEMTRRALDFYDEVSAQGGGRLDTSSLILRLPRRAANH